MDKDCIVVWLVLIGLLMVIDCVVLDICLDKYVWLFVWLGLWECYIDLVVIFVDVEFIDFGIGGFVVVVVDELVVIVCGGDDEFVVDV